MGLLDDVAKMGWGKGLLVGISAVVLVPVLIPFVGSALRPLVKAVIKGGMVACTKARQVACEAKDGVEDMVAEVKSEPSASIH
ncbi:MAG: DUF5132 domain-containing protein [Deltaproteobacteria bacterium]|nr:DUF5132 domain-containing protein [Deltaproteobacteria bacterium]